MPHGWQTQRAGVPCNHFQDPAKPQFYKYIDQLMTNILFTYKSQIPAQPNKASLLNVPPLCSYRNTIMYRGLIYHASSRLVSFLPLNVLVYCNPAQP